MTLIQRVPRTSPARIFLFLFIASLTFSTGIHISHTAAPTLTESAAVDVACEAPVEVRIATPATNFDRIISSAGTRHGVDPLLIHAVIWKESNYRTDARSSQGARGLMQLTADTARRFGCRDASDAESNVEAGTRYLRVLLEKFDGDVTLALAGYNAGEGTVAKHGGVPPFRETQNFVRQIVARYGKTRHPLDSLAVIARA